MKRMIIVLMMMIFAFVITACGGNDGLDTDVTAEISLMTWAGNGIHYKDIGHQNFTAEDLTNKKVASIYATAKAFNEIYPNVKINYLGKEAGPDDGGVFWDQELSNYKDKYGSYPSVFSIIDTVQLLKQGVLADLSVYEDDELYQQLNPGLMEQANYFGMQAALPGYFIPHGMYINQNIIQDEFLPEVQPSWDFDDFSDLVMNGEGQADGYSGLGALPSTWAKQMFIYDDLYDNSYVDLDTEEVRQFFADGMKEWNDYQFYAHEEDYQDEHVTWAPDAFSDGVVTVYPEDPWYLDTFAQHNSSMPGPDGFDVYPFPGYNERETTISTVTDPLGVYNYCNDDGDPECSVEEKEKMDVAYEFAIFMIADSRAREARATQEYGETSTEGQVNVVTGAADASLPVTTGELFDEQMDYWYQIGSNSYYEDKPGFEAMLDIIRSGDVKAISDKIYPWFYTDETTETREMIFEEFWYFYEIGDITIEDPAWLDTFYSKLDPWTDLFNDRLDMAWQEVEDSLITHYGYAEGDERFGD